MGGRAIGSTPTATSQAWCCQDENLEPVDAAYHPGVIYLLRHGQAERGDGDDAARRLTVEGERQSLAAGRALSVLEAEIDACLTSPKVRAADTAMLACQSLQIAPETAAELVEGGFDALALAGGRGNVLLVGHEPDLSNEVVRLTGAKAKLRKGGLAIVDGGTIMALLRPEDLAAIAAAPTQAHR
jgi:phosphohistidine phosphatase